MKHSNSKIDNAVSVAIAIYNGEKHIVALLDSIVAQTHRPAEIVCSDDASTDASVEILSDYAKSCPIPVKIARHQQNIGIIENFLSAFRGTSCPLIAYCDQDDVWMTTKLERAVGAMGADTSLVCHPSVICDGDLISRGSVYYNAVDDIVLEFPANSLLMHVWGHQMVFSRRTLETLLELYENEGFKTSEAGTNFDYGIPFAASLCGRLYFSAEPQTLFRRHAGANSDAGIEVEHSTRSIPDRVAMRIKYYTWTRKFLLEVLPVLDRINPATFRDRDGTRRVYADHLKLVDRKLRLSDTEGFYRRAKQLPFVIYELLAAQGFNKKVLKEAVADILTVYYGNDGAKSGKIR